MLFSVYLEYLEFLNEKNYNLKFILLLIKIWIHTPGFYITSTNY